MYFFHVLVKLVWDHFDLKLISKCTTGVINLEAEVL